MVLKVVPATAADANRAVAIGDIAYGPNPANDILFPGPFPATTGGDHPRAVELAEVLRTDPTCRWTKVIDTDIEERADPDEDSMVAFSMWYIWETPPPPAPPRKWGPGTNPEACALFMGSMAERRNALFAGKKPYVYLKLLHTDPKHQRRGAASMLLKWGADEADRLGLDSYLEASPDGKLLYEKRGFKEIETLYTDLSPWGGPKDHPTTLMLRPAPGSQ